MRIWIVTKTELPMYEGESKEFYLYSAHKYEDKARLEEAKGNKNRWGESYEVQELELEE